MLILSVIVVALFLVSCSQQGSNGAVAGQATKVKQTAAPKECAGRSNGYMLRDCGIGVTTKRTCFGGETREENCPCGNKKDGEVLLACSERVRESRSCKSGKIVSAACPVQRAQNQSERQAGNQSRVGNQSEQQQVAPVNDREDSPVVQMASQNITACGMYGPGNFVLARDLNLSTTPGIQQCIVLRENSALDCQGQRIQGNQTLADAIYLQSNTSVSNCRIDNFELGIHGDNLRNVKILNNNITNSVDRGISINQGETLLLQGNQIRQSNGNGIRLQAVNTATVSQNIVCGNLGRDLSYTGNLGGALNQFRTVDKPRDATWPALGTNYVECQ